MIRKIISFIMISALCVTIFSGCGRKYVSLDDVEILNYTKPQENEKIAVISVKDYGDIKIKLFPEQCPEGVENFEKLIESGYYDGTVFHRVIQNFMIQGGDPTGTGNGGESIWGDGFEQEINSGLRHFSGAVSYATASDKLNGSQFFIVTGASDIDFQSLSDNGYYFPENVADMYQSTGGYPPLDGDYEVFGQVFEGLDICFEIAAVQTDENDRPVSDIIIEKAQITEYEN